MFNKVSAMIFTQIVTVVARIQASLFMLLTSVDNTIDLVISSEKE